MKLMRLAITLTCLSALVITCCSAQKPIEAEISTIKQNLVKKINLLIVDAGLPKGTGSTKPQIIVLPVCTSNIIASKMSDIDEDAIKKMEVTEMSAGITYNLIDVENKVYCIPMPKRAADSNFTAIEYPGNELVKNNPEITLINFILKFSKNPFYLRLLYTEPFVQNPIAYIQDDHLELVDRDLNVFHSLNAFINQNYGSLQKLIELQTIDKQRMASGKKLTLDRAKLLFRNDYHLWERRYPQDTAKVIQLFLNELDSGAKLTTSQLILLKAKLNTGLVYQLKAQNGTAFEVVGNDVTPTIERILTLNQLVRYKQYLLLKHYLQLKAMDMLSAEYIKRGTSLENLDAKINSEIFSN